MYYALLMDFINVEKRDEIHQFMLGLKQRFRLSDRSIILYEVNGVLSIMLIVPVAVWHSLMPAHEVERLKKQLRTLGLKNATYSVGNYVEVI